MYLDLVLDLPVKIDNLDSSVTFFPISFIPLSVKVRCLKLLLLLIVLIEGPILFCAVMPFYFVL